MIFVLVVQQDSFAEQVEAGSAIHLSFEHLDPVDAAFDGSGAEGQVQSGGHRVEIGGYAVDEAVDAGQVGLLGAGEPLAEAVATKLRPIGAGSAEAVVHGAMPSAPIATATATYFPARTDPPGVLGSRMLCPHLNK